MRRVFTLMVTLAALLVVTALGLVFTVLRTEVGAGWVLGLAQDRLAGFSYQHHEGHLSGGLVLEKPAYARIRKETSYDTDHRFL